MKLLKSLYMQTSKKFYEVPALNCIVLDNEISLVLQTTATPPAGPGESTGPDVNAWGENTIEEHF